MGENKPVTLAGVRRAVEHCRTDGAALNQDWFMRLAESYRNLVEAVRDAEPLVHSRSKNAVAARARVRAALPEEER